MTAHRLGLCGPSVTVHMPGGDLAIRFSQSFAATMTGPVTHVCEGVIDPEMFEEEQPLKEAVNTGQSLVDDGQSASVRKLIMRTPYRRP
jgi:hypothetical protein